MIPKSIKNLVAEDIQRENEELYNQIVSVGKQSMQSEIDKLTSTLVILREGIKLSQVELAETFIKEGKSENEAIHSILNATSDKLANDLKSAKSKFEQSAPPAAGSGSVETPEISSQDKAVTMIMERDKCDKRTATKKARREFTPLFTPKNLSVEEES